MTKQTKAELLERAESAERSLKEWQGQALFAVDALRRVEKLTLKGKCSKAYLVAFRALYDLAI